MKVGGLGITERATSFGTSEAEGTIKNCSRGLPRFSGEGLIDTVFLEGDIRGSKLLFYSFACKNSGSNFMRVLTEFEMKQFFSAFSRMRPARSRSRL